MTAHSIINNHWNRWARWPTNCKTTNQCSFVSSHRIHELTSALDSSHFGGHGTVDLCPTSQKSTDRPIQWMVLAIWARYSYRGMSHATRISRYTPTFAKGYRKNIHICYSPDNSGWGCHLFPSTPVPQTILWNYVPQMNRWHSRTVYHLPRPER